MYVQTTFLFLSSQLPSADTARLLKLDASGMPLKAWPMEKVDNPMSDEKWSRRETKRLTMALVEEVEDTAGIGGFAVDG